MRWGKKRYSLVIVIIILLIIGIITGCIMNIEESENGKDNKDSYNVYHFELEIESDNQTTIFWPLPYDADLEGNDSYGNLSDLAYDLKITEGEANFNITRTQHGNALNINLDGTVKIKGNKTIYWNEDQDYNKRNKYFFDDLSMRNKTNPSEALYFVYSSSDNVKIIYFNCYYEIVGEQDSGGPIGLNIKGFTLREGWQTMELSGNAPNYESP